jgi:hypothetical protein
MARPRHLAAVTDRSKIGALEADPNQQPASPDNVTEELE